MADQRRGRSVRRRVKCCALILFTCAGLCLTAIPSLRRSPPFIVYNASASAPIGFYRVSPGSLVRRGDLVLATAAGSVRRLAAERGYLPASVPLVKRVAALACDAVCVRDRAVFIDGRHVADRLAEDQRGRSLPAWSGCRTLASGEVFLLMEGVPDSFDSRYFGPIPVSAIIGRLRPLWTR